MADVQAPGRSYAPETGKSIGSMANYAGAALSLALVVGVGVWGYKLLVRDVSGVPVVRAMEGPMRHAPEEPGGLAADNQGLAVNSVAAVGVAEAPADRLMLAPRPVDLAEEDAPASQLSAYKPPVAPRPDAAPRAVDAGTLAEADENRSGEQVMDASVQALVDQLAAGAKPLGAMVREEVEPVPEESTSTAQEAATPEVIAAVAPKVEGGLGRSLRPRLRPAGLKQASLKQPEIATAAGVQDVAAESIPAGTRLAQLGAFESPEVAKKEWDRLTGHFGEYLNGKSRVIQKAQSGGRTFYRLRAMGFDDLSDARRFCSALVAEKADCIPVVTR